jgi:DNA-binding XRE family transcriptional regulator
MEVEVEGNAKNHPGEKGICFSHKFFLVAKLFLLLSENNAREKIAIIVTGRKIRPRLTLLGLKKPTSLQILGHRIREARKAKGLSQEDLALKSDTAPSYIGGVERGERNPSFKKLCAIARTIGRDVGSLTRNLPLPSEPG